MWYVGSIALSISASPPPTATDPFCICAGPDGNLWVGTTAGQICRVTTTGTVTIYPVSGYLRQICAGSDGNLWVTSPGSESLIRSTTSGGITGYNLPYSDPFGICAGSDGNLWVADLNNAIWQVTTAGGSTSVPDSDGPYGICAGPDGNLWASTYGDIVQKITTGGSITSYTVPGMTPTWGICVGPDNNLWTVSTGVFPAYHNLFQITTSGVVVPFSLTGDGRQLIYVCAGPDGNLWVTDYTGSVWKATTLGVGTEYPITSGPLYGICTGSDGNLWATDFDNDLIWKITTSGVGTSYPLVEV